MENKNLSVKDIAKIAGVSVATVSRVINKNGRFSKETEEKVKAVIKEYNYFPNQLARGLRVSRSRVIGILVPDITNEFFANITLELQTALLSYGYLAFICNTNEDKDMELRQLAMLKSQQVSGLIFIAGHETVHTDINLPVVYIDRKPPKADEKPDHCVSIESDNESGGYLAGNELINCGCQNVICITYDETISAHKQRGEGFTRSMTEAGRKSIIERIPVSNTHVHDHLMYYLLGKYPTVDGIFFSTDYLAISAMKILYNEGIRIPSQIKLVGFDDISITKSVTPSLTTIRQDVRQFGLTGAHTIISLINQEFLKETEFKIPVSLVRRESTRQ